jgi:hypothetical protein
MAKKISKERVFSVELNSKHNLKNLTLTDGNRDTVLLEGTLGELLAATFTEGIILEIIGEKGTLRVDLEEDEIQKKQNQNSSEVNLH